MLKCKLTYYDKNRDSKDYLLSVSKIKDKESTDSINVSISEITYSDLKPDEDDYEETAVDVKTSSDVKIEWVVTDGEVSVVLKSAELEIEFDDEEQEERFYDKDWETEWIAPKLSFSDKTNKDSFELGYGDGLFTLEII